MIGRSKAVDCVGMVSYKDIQCEQLIPLLPHTCPSNLCLLKSLRLLSPRSISPLSLSGQQDNMTEEQGTVFAPSTVLGISRVKVGGMVVEGTRAERGTEEEQAVDIAHFFL